MGGTREDVPQKTGPCCPKICFGGTMPLQKHLIEIHVPKLSLCHPKLHNNNN